MDRPSQVQLGKPDLPVLYAAHRSHQAWTERHATGYPLFCIPGLYFNPSARELNSSDAGKCSAKYGQLCPPGYM